MTYLRGTTFNEHTMAAELTLESVHWRQGATEKPSGYVAAFVRSAKEALAPAAVRSFFAALNTTDRLLSQFGWVLLLTIPLFAAMGVFHAGALATVTPWIKPIKFAISFATFAWTVSLILQELRCSQALISWVRRAIVASVTLEMLCLSAQAWRGVAPTASTTDWLIQQMTTAMVSVNTAILVGLLTAFCGNKNWIRTADRAMVISIRLSIVIFLLGNAVGGYMLARGSHTVGAADGGPGLPFLNWSTIGGDLRIAHFIAIHAIQIVPLFAWLLWQMTPQPALKQRRIAVYAVAALVALMVGGTFVQAMLAHPVIALGR
jgi:hypothetical protein